MGCGASKDSIARVHAAPAAAPTTPVQKALVAAATAGVARLFEHVRRSPPPSSLSSSLGDAEAAGWIATINTCVRTVWEPLVSHAEEQIASSSGGSVWDSLTTVELARLISDAASNQPGGATAVRDATTTLLATAAALWQRQQQRSASAQPGAAAAEAAFPNGPLCRLLGLLSIALCRTVGVEEPNSFQRRLTAWEACREQLGLGGPPLCALLDGRSKGLLLYCAMVSRGDARLKMTVSRSSALWDALPLWEASPFATASTSGHEEDEDGDDEPHSVKLFPRFHGEAGEGHGPRKELFALLGSQLLKGAEAEAAKQPGAGPKPLVVLPYTAASRQHWFDDNAPSSGRERHSRERLCTFAGWLMAQAVCNRAPLEGAAAMPPLLFRCLLHQPPSSSTASNRRPAAAAATAAADDSDDDENDTLPSLRDEGTAAPSAASASSFASGRRPLASLDLLREFDPDAANNLTKIKTMSKADFAAMCELEELDPNTTSREQYVMISCERLLYGNQEDGASSIGWQLDALSRGFRKALPRQVLDAAQFTPSQLAHAICGLEVNGSGNGSEEDFSIKTTFRIAYGDDEFVGSEPLSDALWSVLEKWPPAEKRRFVKFVTGSDRLPPSGSEVITIQMAYAGIGRSSAKLTLGMLPQAHTCDNLLELPNYYEALVETKRGNATTTSSSSSSSAAAAATPALVAELEAILQQRLTTAVHECDVYGLDDTGGGGGHGGGGQSPEFFSAVPERADTCLTIGSRAVGFESALGAPPPPPPAACGGCRTITSTTTTTTAAVQPATTTVAAIQRPLSPESDELDDLDDLLASTPRRGDEVSSITTAIDPLSMTTDHLLDEHQPRVPQPVLSMPPPMIQEQPSTDQRRVSALRAADDDDLDMDDLIRDIGGIESIGTSPPRQRQAVPAAQPQPTVIGRDDSRVTAGAVDLSMRSGVNDDIDDFDIDAELEQLEL